MIYILYKVKRKIMYHMKTYLLLIIEIALATAFIAFSLNHYFAGMQEMKHVEKTMGKDYITLDISANGSAVRQVEKQTAGFYLTPEDMKSLKQIDKANIYYYAAIPRAAFFENEVMEYDYVFIDESLLGLKEPGILINEELEKKLLKKNVQFMDGEFIINILNQKNRIYSNAKNYFIKNIPSSAVSIDMSRSIVFPLEMLETIELKEGVTSHASIYVGDNGCSAYKLEQIIHTLEMKYGNLYHFSFSNKYSENAYETSYFSMIPGYLGKMAVVIMIVIVIGYSGIIRIFLEKRIKELAICKAVGGTDVEIAMELIFEIATICISGCVLGGMIGGGLTKWIIFGTKYQVLYHYKTIVILAMVGILLILVLAGPMISNISKLKITELLNASRR